MAIKPEGLLVALFYLKAIDFVRFRDWSIISGVSTSRLNSWINLLHGVAVFLLPNFQQGASSSQAIHHDPPLIAA